MPIIPNLSDALTSQSCWHTTNSFVSTLFSDDLDRLTLFAAAVTLSPAAFLIAFGAFGHKMHALAVGFSDSLSDNLFVETPNQLFNRLTITTFCFHSGAMCWVDVQSTARLASPPSC
jgi:hypothetical protein